MRPRSLRASFCFALLICLRGVELRAAQALPERHRAFFTALETELTLQAEREGSDAALWQGLGLVRMRLGKLEGARDALSRSTVLTPNDPDLLAQSAYLDFLLGSRESASLELLRLSETYPDNPDVLLAFGRAQGSLGELASAEKSFRRAHELKPSDNELTLEWLRSRRRLGERSNDLEVAFQELFARASNNDQIRYEYAEFLLDSDLLVASVAAARPLVELNPDWIPGRLLLARGYWKANDVVAAVFELEHLPQDGLDAESCLILGQAKSRLGHFEDALRYLELALRREPELVDAHRETAAVYLAMGRELQAERILDAILERYPDDYDALYMFSTIWQANGEFDKAIETLTRLAELAPSRAEAFRALGSLATKRGEYETAIKHLTRAAKQKDDVQVLLMLGQAFSHLGNSETALATYNQAVKMDPRRAETRYMLGQLLMRLGRRDEARTELQVAQQLTEEQRTRQRGGMSLVPTLHR